MISSTVFFIISLLNLPIGDIIQTDKGDLEINPVIHGTFAMKWDNKTIFVDPYGGAERFDGYENPDVIFITDIHGDHLNKNTLRALNTENTIFVVPQEVKDLMDNIDAKEIIVLNNGDKKNIMGMEVEAIPMYNLPESEDSRHPKGRGNGYVINMGGKRVYISGDTEDIPEMRSLKNIDVAFVCMNLPYTMNVDQAASAVLEFQPEIVYPFHFRGGGGKLSNVEEFKEKVESKNSNIEVRLREWYPSD